MLLFQITLCEKESVVVYIYCEILVRKMVVCGQCLLAHTGCATKNEKSKLAVNFFLCHLETCSLQIWNHNTFAFLYTYKNIELSVYNWMQYVTIKLVDFI